MTLLKWLEYLPESALQKHPYLLYWQGLGSQPYNQPVALVCLNKSFQQFERQKDSSGTFLAWAAIVNTYALEWNDFTKLEDWIDWFEENCHAETTSANLHIAMSFMQALMINRPQHPEIAQWISVVLTLAKRCEANSLEVQALSFIINYYIWLGAFHQAETIMEELHRLADAPDATPLILLTHNWLSAGLHIWTKAFFREKTTELIDDSLALAQMSGIHVWDHMFFALRVHAAIGAGDFKQADKYLGKIAKTLDPTRKHGYCHYHYLRAWNYFRQNNLEKAEMHNQTALEIGGATGYVFPVLLCLLEAANICCGLGKFDKAQRFLKDAGKVNHPIQSRIFQFMVFITQAKIFYGMDEEHLGDAALTNALTLGKQQQYFNMLWWGDPAGMEKLCTKALQKNIEVDYVRKYMVHS